MIGSGQRLRPGHGFTGLKIFVMATREISFTRAAAKPGISQSTLSHLREKPLGTICINNGEKPATSILQSAFAC